jgi:hypothetical protein
MAYVCDGFRGRTGVDHGYILVQFPQHALQGLAEKGMVIN